MLIIRIMEYPQPGRMVPNQKGGQNLVDRNNFVYRKVCFSPDQSKQFFNVCCYRTHWLIVFFARQMFIYLSWCIFMLSCCYYCKKIRFFMFLCSEIYQWEFGICRLFNWYNKYMSILLGGLYGCDWLLRFVTFTFLMFSFCVLYILWRCTLCNVYVLKFLRFVFLLSVQLRLVTHTYVNVYIVCIYVM
jgi:hypothetical protein